MPELDRDAVVGDLLSTSSSRARAGATTGPALHSKLNGVTTPELGQDATVVHVELLYKTRPYSFKVYKFSQL